MAKLLLQDAKGPVAEILNMSSTDTRVVEYINEAIEFIMQSTDWANTIRQMRFTAKDGVITFPPEVVAPLKFSVNGIIGQPYGKQYEYINNGPGHADNWRLTEQNLIDVGEFPTEYEISETAPNLKIYYNRPVGDTTTYTVTVRGIDSDGNEIYGSDGNPDVDFTLAPSVAHASLTNGVIEESATPTDNAATDFYRIRQVIKPQTKGYMLLKGIKDGDATVDEELLSTYKPHETTPSYRRFKIFGVADMDENKYTTIRGIFRVGYTPAYNDEDELLINMITPLKLMCRALVHYEHDEVKSAASLEGIVERILRKQVNRYDVQDNLLDADIGYGNGDVVGV